MLVLGGRCGKKDAEMWYQLFLSAHGVGISSGFFLCRLDWIGYIM